MGRLLKLGCRGQNIAVLKLFGFSTFEEVLPMICKYLKETLGIHTVKNDLFLHVSAVKKIVKKRDTRFEGKHIPHI